MTAPATGPPSASLSVNVSALRPVTGSENTVVRLPLGGADVPLLAGVSLVGTGAGPVVNVQLVVSSGPPSALWIPAPSPTSVAVYSVSAARVPVGFSFAVSVAAS